MIEALLFDFDGTLWDSETVIFEAYRRLYDDHGHSLSLEAWSASVGTLDGFDPIADLEARLGRELDRSTVDPWERVDDLMVGVDLRPGVRSWLTAATAIGLRLGIVSSNDESWIRHHAGRLGIGGLFGVVVGADGDLERAKPNPVLYREALAQLGVEASGAVAIEDSPHGIAAARGAGLYCMAVPNAVTRELDLSGADLVIDSFTAMTLEDLLARVAGAPSGPAVDRPQPGVAGPSDRIIGGGGGMRVRFVGGPLDGRVEEIDADLDVSPTIFWPPGADLRAQEDRTPGVDDVVEYLYQGDGTAKYVGGLLGDDG